MSLDFSALGQNGSPEKTVPLGLHLHHELIASATSLVLARLLEFDDYYKDVEIAVVDLPSLAEEVATMRARGSSIGLQRFLDDLTSLVSYALSNGKSLHAIAD